MSGKSETEMYTMSGDSGVETGSGDTGVETGSHTEHC